MPDRHVLRTDHWAEVRGQVTEKEIDRRYRAHALAMCPTCHHERAAFLAELAAYRSRSSELEIVEAILGHVVTALDQLDEDAQKDLATLEGLAFEHQRRKIERARKRFHNPLVADRLIEASRQAVYSDPDKARQLAELAFEAALKCNLLILDSDPSIELVALATAHYANALRAAGDLPAAAEAMGRATRRLDEFAPLVRAEICSLMASLCRDRGLFDPALEVAERAFQLYKSAGEGHLAGRVLLKKSHVFQQQGEIQAAIDTVREALKLLDRHQDLRLYLWAQHALTCYLADAGEHAEARQLLEDNRSLYESYSDEPTLLRRRWVEAKIARGLGEPAEAEAAFLETRDGFLGRGNGYDAALASLELALLYLDQDRAGEVQELAQQMVPIFRAQDVHREALAGLMLFVEAASREAVNRALVEHLADYLRQARNDPSLRFEPPSSSMRRPGSQAGSLP